MYLVTYYPFSKSPWFAVVVSEYYIIRVYSTVNYFVTAQ